MFDIVNMLIFLWISLKNKISIEALPTVSHFLFGCNGTIFIYLHSTCYILYQKRFYCYAFYK